MLCMYSSRCFSQDDPRWSDMAILCNVVWCYGTCLQASLLSFFCLKALFLFFLWPLLHNVQTKIAIAYMREQNCDTRYDTNMIWYVFNGRCRSLMCTSNIAGNTQMASLDWQVTQNRLGVNNAMARGIYNVVVEVTVLCDDEWRCSWCRYQDDGDSSLSSRNTLGNGKTANSKSQMSKWW